MTDLDSRVITVHVDRPYDVTVGRNLESSIIEAIPSGAARVALFYAAEVRSVAQSLAANLSHQTLMVELPSAEASKTYSVLEHSWNLLGEAGFTRSDVIITVGGGATTDLGGFAAATWLRGVAVIHVPTTLLAMVDAAVGGKTGINTPAGKNLVGAFHHPRAVFCDVATLSTLPMEDLRAGFGEIIKCGFIRDAAILEIVEREGQALLDANHSDLPELIVRAISVKAEVVADDFTESKAGGLGREILNYGHTLGHAIELTHNYTWRHGDAISVGMMFVAELAFLEGLMQRALVEKHRAILNLVGLPTSYDEENWPQLLQGMSVDKKVRGNTLRFVVLSDIAVPAICTAPSEQNLKAAFAALASQPASER